MNARLRTLVLTAIASCGLTMGAPYAHASNAAQNDFEVFMQKIRNSVKKNPSIDSDLAKFKDDGSFADVDYTNTAMTNWDPIKHIERLQNFAYAYTNPDNKHYQDEAVYDKIVKGLEYWYAQDPESDNWWHNQISEPQKIGVLLIQMRSGKKQVPEDIEAKTLERILKDGGEPEKWTGANRTDIALHWIYRACLTENAADLKRAIDNVFSPVEYTTGEGFQYDNSYFQHGTQLYIGGYGDEILKGVTQVASYALGTSYELSKDKVELLSKFMRETYYRSVRGQNMMWDIIGRSMSRPNATKKQNTAIYAKRMIDIDPEHAEEFKNIVARLNRKKPADYKTRNGHIHYCIGDYSLYTSPSYAMDVRLASTRTKKCEYGNKENLKTYFLSYGCTCITQTGDEYYNIFPVWDWRHIPGTTAPQVEKIPMDDKAWGMNGTSTFAGGVSDSIMGATAFSYTDTKEEVNLSAKKSWYFFGDEVVCLGAGISSTTNVPVHTTINQCFLGAFNMNAKTLEHPNWIINDNIGYLFPQEEKVFFTSQEQKGKWSDINTSKSKKEESHHVFTVGIDHGVAPKNASYAYIVVPNKKSEKEMEAYYKNNPIEILSNTDKIQAVRNIEDGVWMVTFFEAGTMKHKDLSVTADKPCVLMVKDLTSKAATLHIADPGQTQTAIKVTIKNGKKEQSVTADFANTGIHAGATKAYRMAF